MCSRIGYVVWAGGTWWQDGQREDEVKVVVGGDAVKALEATAEAEMDDNVLAVGALEGTDGLHERATGPGAVAGAAVIHVAGVEAEWAVVAVVAATGQWPDEFVAVAALEALVE